MYLLTIPSTVNAFVTALLAFALLRSDSASSLNYFVVWVAIGVSILMFAFSIVFYMLEKNRVSGR